MPSSNLNRLIVAFLTLAVVASTSVFLFSQNGAGKSNLTEENASPAKETSKAPKNAFVEPLPEASPAAAYVGEDGLPAVTVTDNLTENLAQRLAREMVAENPNGPQTTEQGLSLILPENPSAILEGVTADNLKLESEIRKEALVVIPEEDIEIASNYTSEDIAAYADAINGIVSDNLSQAQIERIIGGLPTAEALNTMGTVLELAVIRAKKISVPAPLADFHKSFLQILAYQRKALTLAGNQDDPLRASLVLDASERNYEEAAERFQTELQKAVSLKDLSGNVSPNNFLSALGDVLSLKPKTARAFLGIGDIVFDPAILGRIIWEYTRRVLLETLKDRLIHQLVQQVIRWVQGGGKPQFVTNWRVFLDDAANKAVGDVIYKVAPQLCSSFGPLIRLTFTAVPPIEEQVACTLDQVVANVQDFYDDFRNGGWITYTTALQPRNNLFGALITTSDIAAIEAAKKKEAEEKRASAGGGFTGQAVCSKSRSRNKRRECIFDNPNNQEVCNLIPDVTYEECVEYQATTPGSVTQQITAAALNSPIGRIVNAQDVAALTSAFINAALNKLIQAGQKGLSSLFGGGTSSAATPGAGGEPSPTTDVNFGQLCEGLSSSTYEQCAGEAINACQDLPEDLKQKCLSSISPPPPEPPSTSEEPSSTSENPGEEPYP